MDHTTIHILFYVGAALAGLLGSATGLVYIYLYVPQDVCDDTKSTVADPTATIDPPVWYAALVLIVGTCLSLSILHQSHSILDYLSLYLVFFALLAIALMDLEWQMIGLNLFLPLAIGAIGWVLLHPISIWLALISGGLTLFGLALWLIHARQNHGDLLLAILVGLLCGADVTNLRQTLLVAVWLGIGICAGALAMLVHGLAAWLGKSHNSDTESFWKQTSAMGPVFLLGALFVVFLH